MGFQAGNFSKSISCSLSGVVFFFAMCSASPTRGATTEDCTAGGAGVSTGAAAAGTASAATVGATSAGATSAGFSGGGVGAAAGTAAGSVASAAGGSSLIGISPSFTSLEQKYEGAASAAKPSPWHERYRRWSHALRSESKERWSRSSSPQHANVGRRTIVCIHEIVSADIMRIIGTGLSAARAQR